MAKFLVGEKFLKALHDAGVLDDDYTYVRRIVIDLEYGNVAKLYVEKYGDDRALLAALVGGIKIVETEEEAGDTRGRELPPIKEETYPNGSTNQPFSIHIDDWDEAQK
jgi:hypothetical protein